MSIFGNIMSAIFGHAEAAAEPASGSTPTAASPSSSSVGPATSTADSASTSESSQSTSSQNVDVEAVLTKLAEQKGGGGNWRTSIVDLLKLLDLDPSLSARKELAQELSVHAGADGSAEENIALHKAVMSKLAENGGKVPDSMKT